MKTDGKKLKRKPKYDFTNGFQTHAVALLLQDESFLTSALDAIDPDYFVSEDLAFIVDLVLDYYREYRKHPTLVALRQKVKDYYKQFGEDEEGECRRTLRLLKKLASRDVKDQQYIRDRIIAFGRWNSMRVGLQKAAQLMKQSESDEDKRMEIPDTVMEVVRKAGLVGIGGDPGIQLFEHLDSLSNLRDSDIGSQPQFKCLTGFKALDRLSRGGIGAGEIGVVIAESGMGKSMFLANIAANACIMGKRVVYITLELHPYDCAVRILARMSKVSIDDVEKESQDYKAALKRIRKLGSGYLRVKYFPPGRATVNDIRAYITRTLLQDGIAKADLIVVDYADEIRGGSDESNSYAQYGDIYSDLINMSYDLHTPIWTASQVNRMGYGEDIIRKEHISDSMKKVMKADLVLSICQTPEEEVDDRARLYIAKSRRGISNKVIPLIYRPERALFKERQSELDTLKAKKKKAKKADGKRRRKVKK